MMKDCFKAKKEEKEKIMYSLSSIITSLLVALRLKCMARIFLLYEKPRLLEILYVCVEVYRFAEMCLEKGLSWLYIIPPRIYLNLDVQGQHFMVIIV